ncbi:FG-GAP repeat domain-containing protein, partial [Bacteroidota bacterium]
YNSSVAWGDYDNDGYLDILLTGSSMSKIYHNNGDNSFTEKTAIELTGVSYGSVAWGDYDIDGDLDILLTGSSISKLYKNNNSVANTSPEAPGNLSTSVTQQTIQFSWDKSTDTQTTQAGLTYNLFIGSTPGAVDILAPMSDISNGLRKLVQPGNMSHNNTTTFNSSLQEGTYYWGVQALDNCFSGSGFSTATFDITEAQASDLTFSNIKTGSVQLDWTRGNKEKCVVFVKLDSSGIPALSDNTSYTADSEFKKGSQLGDGWYSVYNGTGDNVSISGLLGSTTYTVMVLEYSGIEGQEIYLGSSNATNPKICKTQDQFIEQTDIVLSGVSSSAVAWGDYDNDGYLDILLTGSGIAKIYHNNGDNSFTERTEIILPSVSGGSAAWGDYDNDGYLDFIITGMNDSYSDISKIFHNNGDNSFTEQTDIVLPGVSSSAVAWGDYDNDGYLDILLTGSSMSKIFHNNGDNSFTEQTNIILPGVYSGSVAWGDYDNDGYLDFLLTGRIDSYNEISKIYHNNGDNSFSEQTDIVLPDIYYGSVAWGDYDNDGFLDILLTGYSISKIYRNNGANSFIEQTDIILPGVSYSSVAWGDYDNDGYLDILLTGRDNSGSGISKIFHNNGDNSFTEKTAIELPGVSYSSVAWGDYDNDDDLDILLTGSSISKLFKNNNSVANTSPAAPTNLSAIVNQQTIQFSWDKSTDTQTPRDGLSYNLFIGSTPDTFDILSPMSDISNGLRKLVQTGNTSTNNTITFNSSLSEGTYYWGVQALDHCFSGSGFSTATFSITEAQASDVAFSDITTGSTKINWARGNKQKCIVFVKLDSSGIPSLINSTSYTADTVFTNGSQAG